MTKERKEEGKEGRKEGRREGCRVMVRVTVYSPPTWCHITITHHHQTTGYIDILTYIHTYTHTHEK